jgi:hypothetical protein
VESAKSNRATGAAVAPQPKRKLSAKEVVEDIRQGLSDTDLERKYDLTPARRENLFKQLLAKGFMTEHELRRRSETLERQRPSNGDHSSQKAFSPPAKNRSVNDGKASPTSSRESDSGRGRTSGSASVTTLLTSFSLREIIVVASGAILSGILAAALTTHWGTTKTWTKMLGKTPGVSWKWIILCSIIGAVLAFCINWVMKKRQRASSPKQPSFVPQAPRSAGPVSVEEIEEAIKKMERARRDMFGIVGDVGILGIGAAGGAIAAVAVAAFFGATNIWGVTKAGKWLGLSVHGSTPWTWIIGCAIVGAGMAFSVSRLVKSGASAVERKIRNIDELKREVQKRKKEAEKSNVDRAKFDRLKESLTMLLSNNKISPAECDQLIDGVKNGTITYEFAFATVEEYVKE